MAAKTVADFVCVGEWQYLLKSEYYVETIWKLHSTDGAVVFSKPMNGVSPWIIFLAENASDRCFMGTVQSGILSKICFQKFPIAGVLTKWCHPAIMLFLVAKTAAVAAKWILSSDVTIWVLCQSLWWRVRLCLSCVTALGTVRSSQTCFCGVGQLLPLVGGCVLLYQFVLWCISGWIHHHLMHCCQQCSVMLAGAWNIYGELHGSQHSKQCLAPTTLAPQQMQYCTRLGILGEKSDELSTSDFCSWFGKELPWRNSSRHYFQRCLYHGNSSAVNVILHATGQFWRQVRHILTSYSYNWFCQK